MHGNCAMTDWYSDNYNDVSGNYNCWHVVDNNRTINYCYRYFFSQLVKSPRLSTH